MEENRIPKRVSYMNFETARPKSRPRNRWQDEVREDGRIVGGEEWQEIVYDREEWKKLMNSKESSHSAYANGMGNFLAVEEQLVSEEGFFCFMELSL
jgi:hypothetical protein